MEIRDYLQAIRRWLWLPIVLPLLAALITGGLLELQPSRYQADATVIVPAVSARGFSTSAASQYFATFKDVLVSTPVVDPVAATFHVPVKNLTSGLSATTLTASSNIIDVTYQGYKGQKTTAIVRQATVLTLDAVAQPALIQAENAVIAAQEQLQQANAAITSFEQTTGQVLPQQEFNSQQQELNSLLLQLEQAKLAGDTTRAAALQTIITQRQQQLSTLAQEVNQYTSLSDARQAAISSRDHAAQQLVDEQALISANHNPSTVVTTNAGRISKLGNTIRFAAIALALALVLALAFILVLELMRGRAASSSGLVGRSLAPEGSWLGLAPDDAFAGAATGDGNGHGNGNGNGNGNGHPPSRRAAPAKEPEVPQRRLGV